MEETKQLGEQPIKKLLLKFSVPCVMGLLIGALYNIVDQIFIRNSSLGIFRKCSNRCFFSYYLYCECICMVHR